MIEQLRAIFETVLGEELPGFNRDLSPETLAKWDSVNHANLLLAIERHYSIEFSPDEFVNLLSVGNIEDTIRSRQLDLARN